MTRPLSRVLFGLFLACALLPVASPARAAGIEPVGRVGGLGGVNAVAVSPDGAHVYASVNDLNSLAVFTRDASSGLLTRVQTVNGVLGAQGVANIKSIAISPDGKQLYVTTRSSSSQGPQGVSVFARDPGTGFVTLLEIQREGVGGVTGLYDPRCAVVSHDGLNVYVRSRYALASFARNATTGALTFMGAETFDDFLASGGDRAIALTPDGTHLYMIGQGQTVRGYARAPGTGALTFLLQVENGIGGIAGLNYPRNLAFSPDGQHLYVAAAGTSGPGNHEVTVLARDAGTGALTYVERHHESRPLRGPNNVAVDASGSRVYFTASFFSDAAVGFYQRNPGTGALTLAGTVAHKDHVPADTGLEVPVSLATSPDGAHLYVADPGANGIVIFDLRCGDGVVDAGEQCDDGNNLSSDGCFASCFVEQCYACAGSPSVCLPDDGTPCTDDNTCTTADTCAGGACIGTPDDGIACNDRNVCTIDDTCLGGTCFGSAEPEVGCRQSTVPGGAKMKGTQSSAYPAKNALEWKWGRGQETLLADFGDPVGGMTTYTACVFEPSVNAHRLQMNAYPGCTDDRCWTATSRGFKFKARSGYLRRMTLRAGPDGKAAIDFRAKSTPGVLPFVPEVTVQLKAWHYDLGGGPTVDTCWAATFSAPTQNTDTKFKASSD